MRFEIAAAIATQLRFQNVTSPPKFGPEIRNVKHLGKDPYIGGEAGWLTLAFKVKCNLRLKFRYAQFQH